MSIPSPASLPDDPSDVSGDVSGDDVPSEIIREIISYGSVMFVHKFKCVSREWRTLSPRFVNLHLSRSPPALLVQAYRGSGNESIVYSYGGHEEQLRRLIRFPRSRFEDADVHKTEIISVKGVVFCSRLPTFSVWKIWNPASRRIHTLPQPLHIFNPDLHASVLVGAGLYNVYKVIRILARKDRAPNDVEVFSNGHWTNIVNTSNMVLLPGAIGNGTPFWRMLTVDPSGDVRFRLVWFDGFDEPGSFRVENLPWPTNCKFKLGGLADCLCSLVFDPKNALSGLWVKLQQGTEGWTKLCSTVFSSLLQPGAGMNRPTILGFCGESSILIRQGESSTAKIYDMRTGQETGSLDFPENRPSEAFEWRECLHDIPLPNRYVRG